VNPDAQPAPRLLNFPNALSAVRLVGSPFLVVFALADRAEWCLGLFVVLWLTDWLDGKLAVLWNLRTPFGAVVDTAADVTLYIAAVVAVGILSWDVIRAELPWVVTGVASYFVNVVVGLLRFRRVPSYHTRMAKTSAFLAGVAIVGLFAGWSVWALRLAAAAVVVTNLEAVAISLVLTERRVDVPSIFHAFRRT
jgi:CDP-diacylglycerol--glycerol-3-phosphate 3-phosphatidyltransferase